MAFPKTLMFFIIATLLLGCFPDKKFGNDYLSQERAFPVVIDTFGVEELSRMNKYFSISGLCVSEYMFYYIGDFTDTIYINPLISFTAMPRILHLSDEKSKRVIDTSNVRYENPFGKYSVGIDEVDSFRHCDTSEIKIQIDTSVVLSNSYPVLLTNKDTDTIIIGAGRYINTLILETKDTSGKWIPFQEEYSFYCGTGLRYVILPPNQCVLTFAPVFKSAQKVQLRLTMGKNSSEPFWSIDK